MESPHSSDVTTILRKAAGGDDAAAAELAPLVMAELRAIAARALRRERPGHTLQPTLLADEAFMKLVGQEQISWQDRSHFFGIAARSMRRLLVDHARARSREKRGGDMERVSLENAEPAGAASSHVDLLALEDAMIRLEQLDPRQAKIVELKYFAGLTSEEIAHVLGVSIRTVDGDWAMARAWLRTQMLPGE